MTGDHCDELAVMDYASLVKFFIIPTLFCFGFKHETTICTYYIVSVGCIWVLLPHLSLQSTGKWVQKPQKLGQCI